ncbi:patatin-like phospholipase family protein [Kutzneria sp. CA-103260]|uniref:patatin-like phospholipase family protein n=1 Tax=Kutzneria sp. CA-103260 TaxID=2802641 RepID=UPI001BABA281|nr:patatin family protein [Kutzneria sp. CA-103260]QUQ63327.1 patatin-like phospholipase [Kutzneria sp. CA-103260]
MDFVHGDLDVLDVVKARRAAGSRPGRRKDGLRVALVVEGGGMRGVYAGGMVSALEALDLRDAFDVVYGTSAGAFSAVALAVGKGSEAGAVYYEDLASRDFINYRRALTGRGPLISLDYVVDHVLEKTKPLNYELLASSDIPVRTVATRLDTGAAEELSDLACADDWRAALRATSCVPFLCGPAVSLRGAQWIDGSVAEPIAVERALEGDATHVLVLLSRAPNEKSPKGGEHPLMSVVALGLDPVVAQALRRRAEKHASAMELLTGKGLLAVRPTTDCGVSGLTTNIPRLRRASETGAAAVHALFAA